ncbi:uncharacterized protein TNCT_192761, partial [Trichonephila clavata]
MPTEKTPDYNTSLRDLHNGYGITGNTAMKFLALIFLAGLALASAIPVPSFEQDIDEYNTALDDFYLDLALEADETSLDDLKAKLKERFQEILEKVKEAIENGKVVKEDYLVKLKEIKEKLKDLKVDLGNKAKELIEKLKEKAKDYWKKILDKLNPEEKSYADDDTVEDIKNKLKERYQELLEKLRDAIEKGKVVGEDTINKLKELREKMKDMKVDLTEELFADEETLNELKNKLRERFQEILEKIKDAIENGKVV